MCKLFRAGWYVLYVKSRHERKVEMLLKQRKLDTFLPTVKKVRRWSDRNKVIESPLFPSYVIVRIENEMDFYKVLAIKGACAFIQFGGEYAIVSEEEIKTIEFLIDSEDISNLSCSSEILQVGEQKKINHGVLQGLQCEILQIGNKHKVLVQIGSLQQKITATIPSYYFSSPKQDKTTTLTQGLV
jgi:transcriptional antiterminator RfaH